MLQVCAHNLKHVCTCKCVYAFVHIVFAALCNRGRKSQDDGDFKTGLQLLRKPVHCMFSFLLPSAYAPFCYVSDTPLAFCSDWGFKTSNLISAYTDYWWKHNSMHDWCMCTWSNLRIANMAHVFKRSASTRYSSGETCFVQCDWLGKAAPPNSHKGSGAVGEIARGKEEI